MGCVKLWRGLRRRQALANVRGVNPVAALALLAIAGLAAARLSWLQLERLHRFDAVLATGVPLVLLGLVLGPGIGVLDRQAVRALAPLTALAVGWLGAALGARLEWRLITRIPHATWLLCGAQAVAGLLAVGTGAWMLSRAVPALRAAWVPTLPAVLTLGAVAMVSGPTAVALAARAAGVARHTTRALTLAAALDTTLGVLAFTLALALHHPRDPALGRAAWLALTLGSGVLAGMVFLSLTRLRPAAADLGFALLGAVLFGAGAAYAAGSSPVLACAIAASVIVKLAPSRRAVRAQLEAWEHAATAALFIIIGALLTLPTVWILPAALALAALRVGARWAVVRYGRAAFGALRLPTGVGIATAPQGGLALAVAVSFFLIDPGSGALLTTVVMGVLFAQLAAAPLLARALRAPALTAPQPAAEVS